MSEAEGNERGVCAISGHKRKKDYYSDETNIYMSNHSNRRRRRMSDESEGFSSSDDDSSGSEDEVSQAGIDGKSTKERRRKSGKSRKRRLLWSKSPQEDAKYADWKIEVRCVPTGIEIATSNDETETKDKIEVSLDDSLPKSIEVVTYSVHRSTLGVQSEYFERVFLGGYAESTQKKSAINLSTPVVTLEHFENILDYFYTEEVNLNSDDVVSIIHLSDYLGIEELRKQAQAFVRTAIHKENPDTVNRLLRTSQEKATLDSSNKSKEKSTALATYYQSAKVLGMEDLRRAIVYVCSKEPDLLAKDCSLSEMPDIDFWSRLWEARKMHPDQKSMSKACVWLWSENIAHFFEKHRGIANLQTFRNLTDADSLNFILADVALYLMEEEHRLCLDEIEANVYLVKKDDKENALTCLQSRCINALYNTNAGGWQISSPPDVIRGRLRKLPSIVLESILLKTIDHNRTREHFPFPIVFNAGSHCVNGTYKMAGWFKNTMKFTKWGIYQGNPREITLYRYEGEWWISIIPEHHDEPGDCDDIDLYSRETQEEENTEWPLPPSTGWTMCFGESPAPRIRFLYNDAIETAPERVTGG